jgi:hypothetical protein
LGVLAVFDAAEVSKYAHVHLVCLVFNCHGQNCLNVGNGVNLCASLGDELEKKFLQLQPLETIASKAIKR